MCYSTCFASKPYYHCRKCGLCSISVAQMSWVINNSNTIQSITLYFSCTPKVAWLHYLMPSISLYYYRFKIRFETPILRGNDKNATAREKHVGSNVAKVITYFLNFFFPNLPIYGRCMTLSSLILWLDKWTCLLIVLDFMDVDNKVFIYAGVLYCKSLGFGIFQYCTDMWRLEHNFIISLL
jgi:hypothetical protein